MTISVVSPTLVFEFPTTRVSSPATVAMRNWKPLFLRPFFPAPTTIMIRHQFSLKASFPSSPKTTRNAKTFKRDGKKKREKKKTGEKNKAGEKWNGEKMKAVEIWKGEKKKVEVAAKKKSSEKTKKGENKNGLVRLVSAAGTGFFYVAKKTQRLISSYMKLEFRKYDPCVKRHVLFTEKSMTRG